MSLTGQKLAQAQTLCHEHSYAAWLFVGRETPMQADPLLELILEGGLTWLSALIITPHKKIAVVGNYDADPLVASGDWDEVIGYVEDFAPVFQDQITRHAPTGPIAINTSESDSSADGLTLGLYRTLQKILPDRELITSEPAAQRLRGQKTPEEITRIRAAIAEGDQIFQEIQSWIPERQTEREVYNRVHKLARDRNLGFSWDPAGDPIVNHGPDSMIGHGIPSDKLRIQPGHIVHVDLGVTKEGYSSDIQRVWYAARPDETDLPEDVQKAFQAVHGAITAGAELLRPGVLGHEADTAARASLVNAGYPVYKHAFGHQVGRRAHDGGAVLGPQWPRYGKTVETPIRENEIYTLELGITVPRRGYLGIEEMAVVTANGIEWLSIRQDHVPFIPLP